MSDENEPDSYIKPEFVVMSFPKKRDKVKRWLVEHQEGVIIGGFLTLVGVGTALLIKADANYRKQQRLERDFMVGALNEWARNQKDAGEQIYPLA